MARRARTNSGERCTAFVGMWLTPSQHAELQHAAKLKGDCISTFARELLFRRAAAVVAATRRNPEAAALMRELNAIGNNLNQIARHLNISGELRAFDDLPAVLDEHKRAIARVLDL
jgi:hypothetical protein